MNQGPASKLPSFQSTFINNGYRKVNPGFNLASHFQSYEMSCLSENLSFIYGLASATYIHNETQNNLGETSSYRGLTDTPSNIQSVLQPRKKNRKRFRTTLQLKRHSEVHTSEKPFICDICLKGFTQKGALKRHKITHTRNAVMGDVRAVTGPSSSGNDEHTCPECGKEFRTKAYLKQHSVIHFEKKPFSCDVCQKGFTRNCSLKRHKLTHTRNAAAVDVAAFAGASCSRQDDHTCLECLKQFSTKAILKRHSVLHSEVKPFICDVCQRGFTQKGNLKRHKFIHERNAGTGNVLTVAGPSS